MCSSYEVLSGITNKMAYVTSRRHFLRTGLATAAGIAGAGAGLAIGKWGEDALRALHKAAYELAEVAGDRAGETALQAVDKVKAQGKTVREIGHVMTQTGYLQQGEIDRLGQLADGLESYALQRREHEVGRQFWDRFEHGVTVPITEKAYDLQQIVEGIFGEPTEETTKRRKSYVERWRDLVGRGGEVVDKKELFDRQTQRLTALVKLYDAERDNLVARAEAIQKPGDTFDQLRQHVVANANTYLREGKMNAKERKLVAEIRDRARRDATGGRELADYLLQTEGFFTRTQMNAQLGETQQAYRRDMQHNEDLVTLTERARDLQQRIRGTSIHDPEAIGKIHALSAEAEALKGTVDTKHEALRTEDGYTIETDLYPGMTTVRDAGIKVVNALGNAIAPVLFGVAAVGTYVLGGMAGLGSGRHHKVKARKLERKQREQQTE